MAGLPNLTSAAHHVRLGPTGSATGALWLTRPAHRPPTPRIPQASPHGVPRPLLFGAVLCVGQRSDSPPRATLEHAIGDGGGRGGGGGEEGGEGG